MTPDISSAPGASSSTPQAPDEKPSAPPVNILPSLIARIYSIAHPALLLALGATRFEALVADPTKELLSTLPWLTLLQIFYVVLCLPPAGSTPSTETSASAPADGKSSPRASCSGSAVRHGKHGKRKQHANSWACIWSRSLPALLSLSLTFALATPVLTILLVLFGAPLTTHNLETVLCAAHMAVLSATALIYAHGVDRTVWNEVWGIARPADAVWGSALGTGLGAWLGAIPIPLDWDRPWQAFPITILVGAYIGYAVGSLLSRTPLVYGKRVKFTSENLSETEKKTN
ncbi:GPI biosynthesis protein Pig-F [Penicillium robsamsonii]|uniref:GPI biosynthesis protein Pig-F n=1 Tax=Penicillium robsamsonii TaxID=1792511 RepID=UPI0025491B22|nr:GPI biosynthesis protein Pig-F [Penicillium robsamsonii]KAJ5824695.1 GPI biosynthesis protein Pig-F [Penicillium robsamsonii]